MKELTIEQKAQRYDEAIEKAKEFKNNPFAGYDGADLLSSLFPELIENKDESEDEKIRKGLIQYFSTFTLDTFAGFDPKKILAWLEKQSTPQVRTGLEWVNTIDDACDERYAEEYSHGEYCHEQSFKWGFQEGVEWLEKQGEYTNFLSKIQVGDKVTRNEDGALVNLSQLNRVAKKLGEQKPTNKVEPKFKVDDWVVIKQ